MRFFAVAAALFAAVVTAQSNNAISIPEGQSTLIVTAGQPLSIEWTNPSSSTVTIKLQQVPITPDGGITLASGIPASIGGATLQIPAAADVNTFQYTLEIIDDSNPNNYNFSPNFGIVGATGTAVGTASTASSTATISSHSGNSTTTATRTGSSTATGSTQSATGSSTKTNSASASGSTSVSGTTTGSSSSRTSSATTSAAGASQTTSAPGGAAGLKVQSGFLALAIGAAVAVM